MEFKLMLDFYPPIMRVKLANFSNIKNAYF